MGAVSPLGTTLSDSWKAALNGQSGIASITKFDANEYDVRFAGEVKNFNPDLYIEKKEQKKMDLFIQYALASTQMGFDQSGLKITPENTHRIGVFMGSGMGGLPFIEEQHSRLITKGPSRVSPFFIPSVITNLAPGWISIQHGIKGPNFTITSACATGVHSLGEAYNYIRFGLTDAMVAGGTESTVTPIAIAGFNNMHALSTRNDNPSEASRPWDKDRDGFVLGEGAASFIVESLENAQKRGATILCEITGYGASSDAYHITSPHPDGEGFVAAMRSALNDAQLNPSDIQYVNAHGTSTPMGDPLESHAIKTLMKDHAQKIWISSTKSMTGHLLGAAGAVESAFCVMSLVDQKVAPTINLHSPSPECDLDYVPNTARDGKLKHVMNNSFGFGGTNSCLIFSKFEG
ncbi:MAG: beta-ketoacyl-[acyl-carrier-protein] synthase II [Bdellovibrionales bacterium RIFCSPHIGHO2_01_FULL_40_29]|nr:MAG: beta-ketoacyl-[acyl-carrier-protein] synthase II [Bdellovibrionales bacterium RIFCSPHIGHO2_01_FULL_40_29]OFZ33016.1 MAG: beta-ketoacyl-[acyl-carrier-protein] synthase II [Bdellovibrionales bacterium RIFCSPHIGHO2_02_FULL_40_15]